ncbi:VOC family protein [[Eubacterium] hominis]|uniref:VOC family protein n=1 Tax=[Eubacterium] hominis TaxID=2764325 RepID=UPI003A4D6652
MKLETTYICVEDMEASVDFYQALLQQEPIVCNDDRWVEFDCGNSIALYNKKYDEKLLKTSDKVHFNQAYMKDFYENEDPKRNNIMILNFVVDDLKAEYERMKHLNLEVSEIMYVNVHMPYYYFNVIDPDHNVLEITGRYTNKDEM